MVGRHDTRLLENLVKAEKDYHAALANLLALSHSSVASLSAYGSVLNPSSSRAVLSVSDALTAADDALSSYANSIDDWRDKLGEIRRLDSELETAMRDREILITRLIKVSKQKPKGTSNGLATGKPSSSGTKLAVAQAELQACEVHLAQRQQEMDEVVRSAVIDGLEKRCKAMVDCGNVWSEQGRQGLRAMEDLANTPLPNGNTHPYASSVPRPSFIRMRHEENNSIDSNTSLAPSQSASQIGLGRPSEDTHITAASSSVQPQPHPNYTRALQSASPVPSPYRLDIGPAHSIDDHVLPSSTPAHAPDEAEEIELNSSSEDEADRPLEVHDNPARAPATFPVPMPPPSNSMLARDLYTNNSAIVTAPVIPSPGPPSQAGTSKQLRKPPVTAPKRRQQTSDGSQRDDTTPRKQRAPSFSLFGSIAGLFSHKSKASVASGSKNSVPPSPTKPRSRLRDTSRDELPVLPKASGSSGSGWQTRTDKNLREGASDMVVGASPSDSSSSEEDKKKRKGFFTMRTNDRAERETAVNAAAGPSSTNGTTSGRRRAKTSRTVDDTAFNDESMANRRLSRHSSDGALHSRSNSLSKSSPTSPRGSKDDTNLNRSATTNSVRIAQPLTRPAPALPPVAKDTPPTARAALPKTPSPAGGKIRKRAPAKHFDDGLGRSGGALLVGAAAANAASAHSPNSPTTASGNTALASGSGGGVSRSSTVRSTTTSVAGGNANTVSKGAGSSNTPYRRGSLPQEGIPAVSSAGETLSRSESTTSRAAGPPLRGRGGGGNQLMSIVEAPGHSRSRSRDEPRLEVVKAPGSITAPAAPTLYLPRALSASPPPLPAKSGNNNASRRASADGAASGPAKLVLPSELPREEDRVLNGFSAPRKGVNETLASSPTTIVPIHSPIPTIPHPSNGTSVPPSGSGNVVSRNSSIRSNGVPSALMPPPLRSALRNRSPSPAGFVPPIPPTPQQAIAPPPVPTKSPNRPSAQLQPMNNAFAPKEDGGDSASISSYETGHEMFDEGSDAPTVQDDRSRPPAPPPPPPSDGDGLLGFAPPPPPPHDPEKRGTDLSFSTTETDSTSQPHRRKSVRMALPPSVSSTPAVTPTATEDNRGAWPHSQSQSQQQPHHPQQQQQRPTTAPEAQPRRSQVFAERDIWAEEDSDAGGDYGEARKALAKATKAFETAGDLTKRKKRISHPA